MLRSQHVALSRSLMFALLWAEEAIDDAREAQQRARGVALRAAAARARSHALRARSAGELSHDHLGDEVAAPVLAAPLWALSTMWRDAVDQPVSAQMEQEIPRTRGRRPPGPIPGHILNVSAD